MKKRKTILWMLLAVAALAVLVPLASKLPGEKQTQENTAATLALDTEELTRLTVDAGEKLTFVKNGDSWAYEADADFPLDQKKISAMLEVLSSLEATKTITQPASLSSYGLSAPLCRVEAGDTVLSVGSDAAMDGGRYFSTGDGKVYITSSDILTPFQYDLLGLVRQDTAPAMKTLDTVTLERQGMEPLVIRNRQGENLCYSDSYLWFAGTTPLDTENTEALIRHGTDMTWEGCADYRAEDLSAYGLDDPTVRLTVTYTEPEAGRYTLEVGTAVSGQYYARMDDSRVIYWMDAQDVNALLNADVSALYPNEVVLTDWDQATSVTVELAGERFTFTPETRDKEQTEAGEAVQEGETETYWLLDGQEADLASCLDAVSNMVPTGSAAGERPEHAQEVSLTFTQENTRFPEVTLAFYRNTGEDCLVTLNGEPTVLVSRSDVSALYEALTKLVLG